MAFPSGFVCWFYTAGILDVEGQRMKADHVGRPGFGVDVWAGRLWRGKVPTSTWITQTNWKCVRNLGKGRLTTGRGEDGLV